MTYLRLPISLLRLALILLIVVRVAAAAEPPGLTKLRQLKGGMTRAEVVTLLGQPHLGTPLENGRETLFYRLSILEEATGANASDSTLIAAGAVRCDFNDGVLTHIAGLWPKPERPPAGTSKAKIMLVDAVRVYDHLQLTEAFNASIQRARDKDEEWIQRQNAEGNKLVEEYRLAEKQMKRAASNSLERTAAELKAREVLDQINAKQELIKGVILKETGQLKQQVLKHTTLRVTQISDALLEYQKQHGFLYVYEIHANIFSPGTKPLFVSGTDVTEDVVKWIDANGAKDFGLTADEESKAPPPNRGTN